VLKDPDVDIEEVMAGTVSSKEPSVGSDKLTPYGKSASAARNHQEDSTSAPRVRQPSESRIERIARRAHEIYEARGGQHGKAMEDWLQAEREIDAEMDAGR
jgi:hypothetical protein